MRVGAVRGYRHEDQRTHAELGYSASKSPDPMGDLRLFRHRFRRANKGAGCLPGHLLEMLHAQGEWRWAELMALCHRALAVRSETSRREESGLRSGPYDCSGWTAQTLLLPLKPDTNFHRSLARKGIL